MEPVCTGSRANNGGSGLVAPYMNGKSPKQRGDLSDVESPGATRSEAGRGNSERVSPKAGGELSGHIDPRTGDESPRRKGSGRDRKRPVQDMP